MARKRVLVSDVSGKEIPANAANPDTRKAITKLSIEQLDTALAQLEENSSGRKLKVCHEL